MKFSVAILALIVAVCLVEKSDAWFGRGYGYGGYGRFGLGYGGYGYGGLGYGYGGYGLGYGYGGYGSYGLGYASPYYRGYWKRDTASQSSEFINQTQCVYIRDSAILSCHGPSGVVECEAISNFTEFSPIKYEVFGLGRIENNKQALSAEFIKFSLIPRKLDNSAWISNEVVENGVEKSLSLFHSIKYEDFGLRIKDLACYEKFVTLVSSFVQDNIVTLESELAVKPTVSLFGDLVLLERRN